MRPIYLNVYGTKISSNKGESQRSNAELSLKQKWLWELSLLVFALVLSAGSPSHDVRLLSCWCSPSCTRSLKWPDYMSAWLSNDSVTDSLQKQHSTSMIDPKSIKGKKKKKRKTFFFFLAQGKSLWKMKMRSSSEITHKLNHDKTECFIQWFVNLQGHLVFEINRNSCGGCSYQIPNSGT